MEYLKGSKSSSKVLILIFTLVCLVVLSIHGRQVNEIENYSSVNRLLETDALVLHDNLGAQDYSLSYIPEFGWVFIVKNYGQYDFKKVSSAIKRSLESVELLILQDRLDPNTKLTVALKLDLAADHFITFQAKDLKNTDEWTVYTGRR
ncbi:hypothetical protein KGY77_10860 [Candidatus Bipolaricaulota bacterium]|nr:hypothetical protein [Candidatus Bipolaricaulota bacterium]